MPSSPDGRPTARAVCEGEQPHSRLRGESGGGGGGEE